jgi:hypothetical protein
MVSIEQREGRPIPSLAFTTFDASWPPPGVPEKLLDLLLYHQLECIQ